MAIITLSGGTFSGVKPLAEGVRDELGYRLLVREELLTKAADEFGASQHQLESALLHMPGFLEGRGLKRLHYIHCVQAAMAKSVRSDNVVYHGYAGHLLLEAIPHHLRVRVVADAEQRITAVMQGCDLTRDKAIEYIKEWDEKQANWVKWVYGVDTNDPATYDLVVNLGRIPVPSALAIIVQTATRDFQTTPQSQALVEDLGLATEIRAKIGMDRSIPDERIDVEAHDGVVTIAASARYLADADKVRQVASHIPGVKNVESKLEG